MSRHSHTSERQWRTRIANIDYEAAKANIETDAPDARRVETLRTDITETLGSRSGILRGQYRRTADKLLDAQQVAEERAAKPGFIEQRRIHSLDKAQLKIERLQERIDGSPNTFLSRQINRQRRQKIKELEYKKKIRGSQAATLEAKRQQKPEEIKKRIDYLVQQKLEAKRRKATRIYLREQHGVSWYDRKRRTEVLVKLSEPEKRAIMREAILLVRRENIRNGSLDPAYEVDETAPIHSLNHASRVDER